MQIWRQAYMSYPDSKGNRVVRPASKLFEVAADSLSEGKYNLRRKSNNIWLHKGKYTYCGLSLFDNEVDANSEIFDVNKLR